MADELEQLGVFCVELGAVGGHGHARINRNKVGELASDSGIDRLFRIIKVKNAGGVVHAASKEAGVGENTGVRWLNGSAFVFLATSALAGEEIGVGAFDAGRFDRLVDVEANMLLCGKFQDFLVVVDTNLRMMIFLATTDGHFGARIAGLEVMNVIFGVKIKGGFELFFVVVDKTNSFVVTD